jgi:O-succinylbenzoic acid--CoA ligase
VDYARLIDGPDLAVRAALAGDVHGVSVQTSGSTGAPREVLLSAGALTASAHATHEALGGPGQWLLCVPADRVAGAMVLVRSTVAGTVPVRIQPGPFTATAFAAAAKQLDSGAPLYVSLVPTQLARILDSDEGRDALAGFAGVLVGGAAQHHPDPPSNVITTYGASETCGGCVYSGMPIGSTAVRVVDGLIHVAGPTLADGYADGDNSRFIDDSHTRWFVTSDAGRVEADGRLTVLGRADDVVTSGGVKFHPAPIEKAMHSLPWVEQAVVVGVPDAHWGERIVTVVQPKVGATVPPWVEVRETLAGGLGRAAVPKSLVLVEALPRLVSGKIDRTRARQLAKESNDES